MPTPLVAYLKVQKATDQQMLAALRASAANIRTELAQLKNRVGVGAAVRREQLQMTQEAVNRELATFWTRAGEVTEAGRATAAAEAAANVLESSESLLRQVFTAAQVTGMMTSTRATAARGIDAVEKRVSGSSYVPLAESVYRNAALTSGKVDEIVNNALARGASAVDLARDVSAYVNPNTPGGVRYASMRLGRTELNNAFHAQQISEMQAQPWVQGATWHLSGSHPRPDECNDYDGQTFAPGRIPAKPHPMCLCYITPETLEREAFVNGYLAGDFDDYLDATFPGLPPRA